MGGMISSSAKGLNCGDDDDDNNNEGDDDGFPAGGGVAREVEEEEEEDGGCGGREEGTAECVEKMLVWVESIGGDKDRNSSGS